MVMNIQNFLHDMTVYDKDSKTEKGGSSRFSHTSLNPRRKYLIELANLETFWALYCDCCHDAIFTLTEMPEIYMPVIVDVDIKVILKSQEDEEQFYNTEPMYSDEMVHSLIQIYHDVLFEIVEDLKKEDFVCCVLEKDLYFDEKNGKTFKKNGFHLHFPKIFLSRYFQEKELIPRVLQEIKKKSQLFSIPNFEKCIDANYCKGKGAPWLLYGSRKDRHYSTYELTYCVDANMERFHYRQLLTADRVNIYDYTGKKINFNDVDYYLPRILSVLPCHRKEYQYEIKSNLPSIHDIRNYISKEDKDSMVGVKESDITKLQMIEKLLEILSKERASERNQWMYIGWILFNIAGKKHGYKLWTTFSKKCEDKFDEKVCSYEWSRMKKGTLTIGSLKHLAKQDNPEEYGNIMKLFMNPYIEKSIELKGSHNDLAKALFEKYDSEFVCSSIQHKLWYEFDGHIWKRLDEGITLRKKITDEIVPLYFEMMSKYQKDLQYYNQMEDKENYKKTGEKVNVLLKLISNLKSAPFKNYVMREAMEVFYSENFVKKLDSNPYLIAFQNGVYDLENHQFREGRPSDYLSLKLNIDYRDDLHINHPEIKAVEDFFVKVFPNKNIRDYFMNISCEVFVGGNGAKIFQIWTGEGDNAKSVTEILFEKMLGPYSIKLPTSLITGKRTASSSACPELVRAGNGVRFAVLQEPDKNDTINIGILKELSGNDTFFARGLFKDGEEITPMFKLVLICNEPPKLPHSDKATWNRIRVIPFESTFCDDAPSSFDEQLAQKRFPKDKNFSDNIPKMVEAFAWLLLNRLKCKPKIIQEPNEVIMATSDYRKTNDIYRQFTDEMIYENDEAPLLSITLLYNCFKDWYKESMNNTSGLPTKHEIREYFTKLWGPPSDKNFWKGYEIRDMYKEEDTTFLPI
jgi:P4 family phage/plasmid primase-like protien